MKFFASLCIAALMMIGAYTLTFGVPVFISDLMPISEDAAQGKQTGQPQKAQSPTRGRRGNSETAIVQAPLQIAPYSDILRTIGSLKSKQSTTVIATESGDVVSVNMVANATVAEGDVLLELDRSAEALDLEIANAQLQLSSSTVNRYVSIQASGVSGVTEMVLQEAQVAQRLARANAKIAQLAYDERTIRAPISGQLGLVSIEQGDYVNVSDEIVTIDSGGSLVAEFEVPERAIGMIKIGTPILAGTPVFRGHVFKGRITGFDVRLDNTTRSITVEAEIDNIDKQLRPGMTLAVRIIKNTDPLPVVPTTAITWDRGGASLWVVENGVASKRSVTMLYQQGNQVWIQADLPDNTIVVTEGAQKLSEGAKVRDTSEVDSPGVSS